MNILKEEEISSVLINSLPGIFYLQDRDGNYLRWNDQFEKVSGYTPAEIRERKPFDFFDPADHDRLGSVIDRVFERGYGEIEIDVVTKSGTRIPYYFNGRLVMYESQPCLIGMGINVSGRVNAERETRKNASYLRAILDNINAATCLLDSSKRLMIFNNEFEISYRKLSGEYPVAGIQVYEFLPPEERRVRYQMLDRVLQGNKETIDVNYERNGERLYYRSFFTPIITDDIVTGISCYSSDLTLLKRTEQNSQKNQERLNYHINNSPLAVIEYDRDFRITFWSKRAGEMFGWNEQEVTGKRISEFLVVEEDIAKVTENILLPHHNSHEKGPIANRNLTKDGRVLQCRWHNSLLTDEDGNIETVMSIIRDITDLMKAERQREEIAADLVRRNNELEQFTYIVSHNLRSPVASLIGLTDILSRYEVDEAEKKQIVSGIGESARMLDSVITDLNNILHLKTGLNEKKKEVSLSALIGFIERNIRRYPESGKFSIETDFSLIDTHYTLKHYLSSIFSNLISNSIKYKQPDKDPIIWIKSEIVDNKLVITFRDNGIGFDLDKTADDVFGLYKRFHFHVEGKGLGLYMVKSQSEIIGGRVFLSSEVNKGSEFRLEFDR